MLSSGNRLVHLIGPLWDLNVVSKTSELFHPKSYCFGLGDGNDCDNKTLAEIELVFPLECEISDDRSLVSFSLMGSESVMRVLYCANNTHINTYIGVNQVKSLELLLFSMK